MKFLKNSINGFLYKIVYFSIIFYQNTISPIIPARCRYYPTCSNYGKQALAWHGVKTGSWLLLKRIGRCHPLGGHGIDFVPLPLASYTYQYLSPNMPADTESAAFIKNESTSASVYRDHKSYVARLNHLMKS